MRRRPLYALYVTFSARRGRASIPLGILLGGVAVTLLVIGLCYLAVTGYGFFNPAFHELDCRPDDEEQAAG